MDSYLLQTSGLGTKEKEFNQMQLLHHSRGYQDLFNIITIYELRSIPNQWTHHQGYIRNDSTMTQLKETCIYISLVPYLDNVSATFTCLLLFGFTFVSTCTDDNVLECINILHATNKYIIKEPNVFILPS